jgi:ribosome-associated protein
MNGTPLSALELVKLCCGALEEKKAGDLLVLDVSEQSSITDYLVLATGSSEPHLRALRVELEKVIDASKTRIVGMEVAQDSGWIVVDAFDVMIHLFSPDARSKYRLENLWKDAVSIPVSKLMAAPKAAKAPKEPKAAKASKAPKSSKPAAKKSASKAVAKKPAKKKSKS